MHLRKLLFILVFLVGIWYFLPVRAGVVLGDSMYPTLKNGQLFVLDKAYYHGSPIGRGDVVAMVHEGQVYVKRVYGVPGDVIWELRYPDTPDVIIDKRILGKVQAAARHRPGIGKIVPLKVPAECIFVLGDDAGVSYDSRDFGPVPDSCVLGRVRI